MTLERILEMVNDMFETSQDLRHIEDSIKAYAEKREIESLSDMAEEMKGTLPYHHLSIVNDRLKELLDK
jgi:hypothetical protein